MYNHLLQWLGSYFVHYLFKIIQYVFSCDLVWCMLIIMQYWRSVIAYNKLGMQFFVIIVILPTACPHWDFKSIANSWSTSPTCHLPYTMIIAFPISTCISFPNFKCHCDLYSATCWLLVIKSQALQFGHSEFHLLLIVLVQVAQTCSYLFPPLCAI